MGCPLRKFPSCVEPAEGSKSAAVLAMGPKFAAGYMVIAVKEMNSMILPASAGLTIFLPVPPNSIFATPTAKMLPKRGMYQASICAGRQSASKSPVTREVRSN